jgi:hypothetical protein
VNVGEDIKSIERFLVEGKEYITKGDPMQAKSFIRRWRIA